MGNKIVKTLINNLGYKILAVVMAFFLWLAVYNIDDPKMTRNYTTNVSIENTSVVTEQNKCFEILEGGNSVTFPVTGKRSVLKNLADTDFKAIADLKNMILEPDGVSATVPIEIRSNRSNSSLTYPSRKFLKIGLEDLMSKRLVISANTTGTVAKGYALGDVIATNPNVLKISGPASIVSRVSSAVATIDVEGMSVNLSDNVVPKLFDIDGNEVDTKRLSLSNSTVTVSARILVVKEIPILFKTTGTPTGNNNVVDIISEPSVIAIKGSSTSVNAISILEMPEELINVNGMYDDFTTVINVAEHLPEGISLVNTDDAMVTVTIRIEPYMTERFPVDTSRLQVRGLDDIYAIEFVDEMVYASISALQSDLTRLRTETLIGKIDVSELEEGTHLVPLELDLNENTYAYQQTLIQIEISRNDDIENPESDNDESGNSSEDSGDAENNNAGVLNNTPNNNENEE